MMELIIEIIYIIIIDIFKIYLYNVEYTDHIMQKVTTQNVSCTDGFLVRFFSILKLFSSWAQLRRKIPWQISVTATFST